MTTVLTSTAIMMKSNNGCRVYLPYKVNLHLFSFLHLKRGRGQTLEGFKVGNLVVKVGENEREELSEDRGTLGYLALCPGPCVVSDHKRKTPTFTRNVQEQFTSKRGRHHSVGRAHWSTKEVLRVHDLTECLRGRRVVDGP